MKTAARNLAIIGFITGSAAVLAYYYQTQVQMSFAPTAPTVSVEPAKATKTLQAESHYQACLAQAEQSHRVSWEIGCENLNPGAAQKYNACVTQMALRGQASAAPHACQTQCLLPKDVAGRLGQSLDTAKSRCQSELQSAEQG